MISTNRGAFYGLGQGGNNGGPTATSSPNGWVGFNASYSSPIYKDNAHVRPLSLITNFIIRY